VSEVLLPQSLDALWPLLEPPGVRIFAGGTDVFPRRRNYPDAITTLVGLERIEALRGVRECGGDLVIGAATPLSEVLASGAVRRRAPVLTQALACLGSPLVRNAATLGGNLQTASPAGDSLPPLFVLDAQVELQRRDSLRTLPVSAFILGPGRTALEPGEIATAVRIPPPPHCTRQVQHFEKLGLRSAMAIAVASLAASIELDDAGVVQKARLAWGSVHPGILVRPEAEAALLGAPLSSQSLERAGALAQAAARPIDDSRATARYRREMIGRLLPRLLPKGA
jgi:CO/xanthine dehydrogenase FAD-binding subunit